MSWTSLEDIATIAQLAMARDERSGWLREIAWTSDPGCLYYRFFAELVGRYAPLRVLEIGTYIGSGAAHFAERNIGGLVVTVDINPETGDRVGRLSLAADAAKVIALVGDSRNGRIVDAAEQHAPYDVLFIDGEHTLAQARAEFLLYAGFVRPGGLILLDDLKLSRVASEMEELWQEMPSPKLRLDELHATGFGAVMVAQ